MFPDRRVPPADSNPLQVGNWGTGTMTVSNGAIVNVALPGGVPNSNCAVVFCGNYVGNAAGSNATLTLTGAGTTMNLAGQVVVGNASVFTNPPSSSTFGTPGGTTTAALNVLAGATLNTYNASVSTGPSGANPTGGEHTIANIIIDGANSVWNVTQNVFNGAQAFMNLAALPNATATIDVTGGGKLVFTGGPAANNNLAGINLTGSGGQAGGTSTINVSGANSAIVVAGDTGVINVGRNGGTATLNVTGGGQVYGTGTNGLPFLNVARQGSNATLNVGGAGSSIVLSGVGGAGTGSDGRGPGGTIGRESGSVGAINVTGGGTILVRDGGVQAATASGAGFTLGRDAGATGSILVSGTNSKITIEQTNSASVAPGLTVGQTGTGSVTVSAGGAIVINDGGVGGSSLTLGRDANSSGSVTVTGSGSSIAITHTGAGTVGPSITVGQAGKGEMVVTNAATVTLNGSVQRRIFVGNFTNGEGTLTVSNGASIAASYLSIGNNGGTGTATIDNAAVNLNGFVINPADNSVRGAGFNVGRGTGSTGTLNLAHGAQVTINTAAATPEIFLGGTGLAPGGDGTLNMSGGSSIAFTGTGAAPRVSIGHSGSGLLTMVQASTIDLPSDGSVIVGANAGAIGQVELQSGSSIHAGSLFGVGHNSTNSTGAQATVYLASGSSITATNVYIGEGGCLGGNGGTIHGNLTMDGATSILGCSPPVLPPDYNPAGGNRIGPLGILSPGDSPGRLVIDGGFNFISGTIVLEVFEDELGQFVVDEIVFAGYNPTAVDLQDLNVVYSFLGDTNPEEFAESNKWILDTFFKVNSDPDGLGLDAPISSVLGTGETLEDLFAGSDFGARADAFTIEDFAFDLNKGVTVIVAVPDTTVPEPGTLMLMLLGMLLLAHAARQRQARCSSQPRVSAIASS